MHLRNAPTRLMKELGYGKDYRYAHDEADGVVEGENYFPEEMGPRTYYHPVPRGLEIRIGEKLEKLRGKKRRGDAEESQVVDAVLQCRQFIIGNCLEGRLGIEQMRRQDDRGAFQRLQDEVKGVIEKGVQTGYCREAVRGVVQIPKNAGSG